MEKKLTIAIDVDGVLRDNLGVMLNLYNREFNDSKTIDDITNFKTDIVFPRIKEITGIKACDWFFQNHSKEIFDDAKPFPYVSEDIKYLQNFANIIICTYQKTYKNKIQALRWLEKCGIMPDGICFLKDKTKIESDFFIDDNDWNFLGSKTKHGILVNAPYNKKTDVKELIKNTECKTLERVNSFHEFVCKFFKKETESI